MGLAWQRALPLSCCTRSARHSGSQPSRLTRGWRRIARAMASRCIWPPDSWEPPSPRRVASPSGRRSMKSRACFEEWNNEAQRLSCSIVLVALDQPAAQVPLKPHPPPRCWLPRHTSVLAPTCAARAASRTCSRVAPLPKVMLSMMVPLHKGGQGTERFKLAGARAAALHLRMLESRRGPADDANQNAQRTCASSLA